MGQRYVKGIFRNMFGLSVNISAIFKGKGGAVIYVFWRYF